MKTVLGTLVDAIFTVPVKAGVGRFLAYFPYFGEI
jgi:hypothetical protein